MQLNNLPAKLMARRSLALEQNQKMFNEANALSQSAFDLLDHCDFNHEMFDEYLQMRHKAESLFREAIEHLGSLNEHFPPASSFPAADLSKSQDIEQEMA